MKRYVVKRDEICHFDDYNTQLGFVYFKHRTAGNGDFHPISLKLVSKRTGNVSRMITACPIEIENVSNLYWLLFTDCKIRSKERVFYGDKEIEATPIARVKYFRHLIYSLKEV